MPDKPNNPFKFWEELKRRKVVRVIIGYAAATYVILELVSIITEPFGLPDWTLKLVFVLLCIGFILSIYFSWVFDITSKGIKKTESAKVIKLKQTDSKPEKWKLKISDIIIAVLIIVVLILAYPKVFHNNKNLASMTMPVTFINELGEEETRQVFKDEYIHSLVIFHFSPDEVTDSTNFWLKHGIYRAISEELNQFNDIIAYRDRSESLQQQIDAARERNCPYFLTGSFRVSDGDYNITTQLYQTNNGSVKFERKYHGRDFFSIIDSISLHTRIDIGVNKYILENSTDLPFVEYMTNNIEAYKYFIFGDYSDELLYGFDHKYVKIALEMDTTFAFASFRSAFDSHRYESSKISTQKYIDHTMRQFERFPEYWKPMVWALYFSIIGDIDMAISQSEMQYKLQPKNIDILSNLIDVYVKNSKFTQALEMILRLNELAPDNPQYQEWLGNAYLLTNKIDEGLRYINKCLENNPQNTDFLLRKGQYHLHKGELDEAKRAFQDAINISPQNVERWSLLLDHIEFIGNNNLETIELEKFSGFYRLDINGQSKSYVVQNGYLVATLIHRNPAILYPLSDTSFVGYFGFHHTTFYLNEKGKPIKQSTKQFNSPIPFTGWKQDSLIQNAEELLVSNRNQEALMAFQNAYAENPEHFYLANYIKHLEFILSDEYVGFDRLLELYQGIYSDGVEYYKDKNQLFGFDAAGLEHLFLPISENQFMNPNTYDSILEFVKENNQVLGFKEISIIGDEVFFKKLDEQALANQNN